MRMKLGAFLPLLLLPLLAHAQTTNSYTETNLISDGSVPAQKTDLSLINPWGVAIGQQTPFWINSTGAGLSQVYDGGMTKQFVVGVPPPANSTKKGTPTGIALNPSMTDFMLPQNVPATFLFDSLDGTITAWYSGLTNAEVVVDNSAAGAVYTGLAIDNNGQANFLLAANSASGKVDVFDTRFKPASLSGSFVDPAVPAGFAPFNVHIVGTRVFVTYALQTPGGGPPVRAAGAGYVSVFNTSGNLVAHAISGGSLNAPWGVAIAPAGFGQFSGSLLVGNFGDGIINAYDPASFALLGQLKDATGSPIAHDRLWEILFGSNGTGDPHTLYFSAGVNNEQGGLFGSIVAAGPPVTGDFQVATTAPSLTLAPGATGSVQIQVAPNSAFSSPVTFSVSGMPAGLAGVFSPSSVTPTAGAAVTTTLTIAPAAVGTTGNPYVASGAARAGQGHPLGSIVATFIPLGLAGLLPLMLTRRKTRASFAAGAGLLTLFAVAVTLSGCSYSKPAARVATVATGTSTVTVTATSGSLVHTTTFTLIVQ